MSKRKCCCVNCCDDFLTTEFVTIFGEEMDTAVPVSSDDLIVLKLKRPSSRMNGYEYSFQTDSSGQQVECGTCCRSCDVCSCTACPPGDNPECFGVPNASGLWEYGGECRSCLCEFCPDQCGGSRPLQIDQTQVPGSKGSEIVEDIPNVLKKFFNKIIKTPTVYTSRYNVKNIDQLQTNLVKRAQLQSKIEQKNQKDKNNYSEFTGTTKNAQFQTKLNIAYPTCKQCLEEKGYDIDCIRNNDPNCLGKKIDFCSECGEECTTFCDSSYGDTENQNSNIDNVLLNYDYVENYATIKPDKDNGIFYSGKEIESNSILDGQEEPTEIIDQTLDIANFLQDDPESTNPTNIPPGFPTNPCSICSNRSGAPGGSPLYIIYRYSYCGLVWYPPEFLFNYNVKVNQGNGYKKIVEGNSRVRTCDFLYSGILIPDGYETDVEVSCVSNFLYGCANDCEPCRDSATYPCQCGPYPHISGGVIDTVKRKFNVSRSRFYGGYLPSMDPFSPSATLTEIGCNTCASARVYVMSCKGFYDIKKAANANWPKASQLGLKATTIGSYCNIDSQTPPGGIYPYFNPNYNFQCFVRGISPYLSRVAASQYRAAYDIFHYGSYYPPEYEVLGPSYENIKIQEGDGEINGWSSLEFKKTYNKKNLLYHKMVGLVGIEHFFEAWAYHSKSLFASQPPIVLNSCNLLIGPYERAYAGTVRPTQFTYDPREALRYQLQRGIPRTVMYGSSTVPIFFSDIYALEVLSKEKQIKIQGREFDSEEFLEKFYLYFYNMTIREGEKSSNTTEPLVLPEDKLLYDYISDALKAMIQNHIISIKDHAVDIADELVETLDDVSFAADDTKEEEPQFKNEFSKTIIGGSAGYFELRDYLIDLAGITANDPPLSLIKSKINGTVIKDMVNTDSMIRSEAPGPMFMGPRRARLLPTPKETGITAWGCCGGCSQYSPDPVPETFGGNDFLDQLSYKTLYSGQGSWFAVTENGKIRPFGDNTDRECLVDTDPNNFNASLGCIPLHLSYQSDSNSDLVAFEQAPDGYVEKLSSKGNFAVALVNYQAGEAIGSILGHPNQSNSDKKLFSNSGNFALNPSTQREQSILSPFEYSCSAAGNITNIGYTVKAWGPNVQYGIFYDKEVEKGTLLYRSPSCLTDNETDQLLYPPNAEIDTTQLLNKSFMWKDVATGAKHTVAITTDGALFVTPDSDNTYKQASYGIPTADGTIDGSPLRLTPPGNFITGLQYYLHYPRPTYFSEDEWRNLIGFNDSFDALNCTRETDGFPCDIRCYLFNIIPGTNLLPSDEWQAPPRSYPPSNDAVPDRPLYTAVGSGHYHSVALSNDNNLRIWGQYVKIDEDGNVLGPTQTDSRGNTGIEPIDVFLPSNEIFADSWTLGGYTYGCQNPFNSEAEERILVPTTATKTINSGAEIFALDGGPDYTIMARHNGSLDRLVVWGYKDMVEAVSGAEYSGLTAQAAKSYDKIIKIVAGPNTIAVLHRPEGAIQNKLDLFIRPSETNKSYDYGIKSALPDLSYNDVCLTAQSAAGLYEAGLEAHVWNYDSFSVETGHNLMQFEDFENLPQYFRSQAFFRAVPGKWDFSKWLYGRPCHLLGTYFLDNIVAKPDSCSIYYQKGDINRSYTGHPKYYWMRSNWRRVQQSTPLHTKDPSKNTGCGLIRNAKGEDGLSPDEFGTGGETDSPLATANRSLNTVLGGCYSGDICWIGDGSPSPYSYQNQGFNYYSGKRCACLDKTCNCPPSCRTAVDYNCNGSFAGTICFDYPVFGRSGFNSNKDYFVQSHKAFGKLGRSITGADCCGVLRTNITHFFYAKRDYYYAYDFDTKLYSVEEAPLKYRSYYLGGATTYILPPEGITYEVNAGLVNELMTPKNAIPSAYQVDAEMSYPFVYCGGFNLRKLKDAMSKSLLRYNNGCGTPCNPALACTGDVCPEDSEAFPVNGCVVNNPGEVLMGPGGWLYAPTFNECNDRPPSIATNGTIATSAFINDESLTLPAGASDIYLGPLVKFKEYSGPLPPGFTDRWKQCFIGDNCPCEDNLASCAGCSFSFSCSASALYTIEYERNIDDLSLYYPADKSANSIADLSPDEIKQLDNTLFRVYEPIFSDAQIPGFSGSFNEALCFLGDDDIANNSGSFRAVADEISPNNVQILAYASNIRCIDITD